MYGGALQPSLRMATAAWPSSLLAHAADGSALPSAHHVEGSSSPYLSPNPGRGLVHFPALPGMKSETSSGADFEEKSIEPVNSSDLENVEEFPDIDEGKSPEERAQIVSLAVLLFSPRCCLLTHPCQEKRLLRKLDWHLIPWLTLLPLEYRQCQGGWAPERYPCLGWSIHRCAIAVLHRILTLRTIDEHSAQALPALKVTGLVHDFSGLAAARWFLGMTEAGLFPGISYYLSCWYKRDEFGLRLAIFFSASALAGSFGGLLAAAIAQMKDIGGKPGWAVRTALDHLHRLLD
nr:putative transporter [Quercus suber]